MSRELDRAVQRLTHGASSRPGSAGRRGTQNTTEPSRQLQQQVQTQRRRLQQHQPLSPQQSYDIQMQLPQQIQDPLFQQLVQRQLQSVNQQCHQQDLRVVPPTQSQVASLPVSRAMPVQEQQEDFAIAAATRAVWAIATTAEQLAMMSLSHIPNEEEEIIRAAQISSGSSLPLEGPGPESRPGSTLGSEDTPGSRGRPSSRPGSRQGPELEFGPGSNRPRSGRRDAIVPALMPFLPLVILSASSADQRFADLSPTRHSLDRGPASRETVTRRPEGTRSVFVERTASSKNTQRGSEGGKERGDRRDEQRGA